MAKWKGKDETNPNKKITIEFPNKSTGSEQDQSDYSTPDAAPPPPETIEIETTDGRIVTITIAE